MKRLFRLLTLPLAVGLAGCNGSWDGPVGPSLSTPSNDGGLAQSPAVTPALQGLWKLLSLQQAGGPLVPSPSPGLFTAEFRTDGQLSARADCNMCGGAYEAGDGTLAVDPVMACTLAQCQSAPLDTTYTALLVAATVWSVDGATLELRSETGTLRFGR